MPARVDAGGKDFIMHDDDRGVMKFLEFLFSGEPGSFVFWGLALFIFLTRKNKSWIDHDGWIPGYRRNED